MSKWIDFTTAERQVLVQQVAGQRHISEAAVEKDWWVTMTLKALFATSISRYLLFKGGTSLSKGWHLINRFSEDIDISIDRQFYVDTMPDRCQNFIGCANNQQIKKLRILSKEYLTTTFIDALASAMRAIGLEGFTVVARPTITDSMGQEQPMPSDKDPVIIDVFYPSIVENDPAIRTRVMLEISCLSMNEPSEVIDIQSLISNLFHEEDNEASCKVFAVLPERTFLEKAFLLNEEYQKKNPRTLRMSRHLYDLEKIMDTPYGKQALQNLPLYEEIIAHRKKFYHVGSVDYDTDAPDRIQFVPTGEILKEMRKDYEDNMVNSFIYGDNGLTFDELISRLSTLQERFHSISQKANE